LEKAAARPTAASQIRIKIIAKVADKIRPSHAARNFLVVDYHKAILLRHFQVFVRERSIRRNECRIFGISSFTITVWHSRRLITSRRISRLAKACSRAWWRCRAPARPFPTTGQIAVVLGVGFLNALMAVMAHTVKIRARLVCSPENLTVQRPVAL